MKAFLMYGNEDFDLTRQTPVNEQELIQDLELNTLLDAMALEDDFLFEVAKKALLSSLRYFDISSNVRIGSVNGNVIYLIRTRNFAFLNYR